MQPIIHLVDLLPDDYQETIKSSAFARPECLAITHALELFENGNVSRANEFLHEIAHTPEAPLFLEAIDGLDDDKDARRILSAFAR